MKIVLLVSFSTVEKNVYVQVCNWRRYGPIVIYLYRCARADGRGLPNCERALDMTRHGHLLEDTAERKLKVVWLASTISNTHIQADAL